MKVVVIGGGIAGLTMAILLRKQQRQVIVCERNEVAASHGHAFLMSIEGLSVLNELNQEAKLPLKKQAINLFNLKRPDDTDKIKIQLDDWFCMKRVDLIEFLTSFFDQDTLKTGRSFSHFIYEQNKAVAAVFENGDIEYGDLFIGADGSNSKVRESIFGPTLFSQNEVNEVVGIASYSAVDDKQKVCFKKFQSDECGLAFGYIPVSDKEVVWFMQYDLSLIQGEIENSPESIQVFCRNMLSAFPEDVLNVLERADFNNTYIWKTRDFDLLSRFHAANVVLIGDAAHLALPFTSAGTSNAITDAKCLSNLLSSNRDPEQAFADYYAERYETVRGHIEQGRHLKETFLNPEKYSERSFLLPLIKSDAKLVSTYSDNPLKIIYFTDPICSTCWIIQPILRKLKLVFGEQIHLEYYMGGLLPSWKDYNKGIIKTPLDAAKHWDEVNALQDYYLSGDIWIDDPLHSSFPPSIAFKAAQIQSNENAIKFLRRMKEMVFMENKNITRWDVLEEAALESGLDTALLKQDMQSRGEELFNEDLRFKNELNVSVFPTFFFVEQDEIADRISGYQPYERFEEIILRLRPYFSKESKIYSPEEIFGLFGNITSVEYSFLTGISNEEATRLLEDLWTRKILDKHINNKGTVWALRK
ncbi:MAG: FAD-dependent oxidoreductase [Bacteroidota bacterium]|jgi:2-polyprenyl-6-methoxyphenol hydroxylase-like FAD-dependent oxidoreductase/predicted DsbA family dithiol-disulfide isomerase